jgi:hypothetical protein
VNRRRAGCLLLVAGASLGVLAGAALIGSPARAATAAPPTTTTTVAARVHAAASTPPAVPPVFSGDVQAVGVRIEADEPLPAGPGDIPSMTGQLNSQENFSNATASVDLLGAVVGPKLADPTGDGHQYTQLPQATCVYPSAPNTDSQSYPFDGTDQQTAQSQTTCSGGPSATGLAYATQLGGNAGVTNPAELNTLGLSALPLGTQAAVSGHESLGPDTADGSVRVAADAEVHDFSIPGLLKVASVAATGWTEASGRAGGASTSAQVQVTGLTIGGATISVGPQGVQLGSGAAVPVSSAQALVSAFNTAAGAVGCDLTVLSNPATYPQGPLFSRPPLPDRVSPAGTDAGSTAAGVAVRCVVPDNLNPTNFKPLILQLLFGFVGTEAGASTQDIQLGIGPSGIGSAPATLSTGGAAVPVPALVEPALAGPAVAAGEAVPAAPSSPAVQAVTPPMTAAPSAAATTTRPAAPVGALVALRTTLEASGMALALLIALAGLLLIAPWRVTLAPVDHPEA